MWDGDDKWLINLFIVILSPINRAIMGALLIAGGLFLGVIFGSQYRSAGLCQGLAIIILIGLGFFILVSYDR